jgi:hypothetical protein
VNCSIIGSSRIDYKLLVQFDAAVRDNKGMKEHTNNLFANSSILGQVISNLDQGNGKHTVLGEGEGLPVGGQHQGPLLSTP